MSIINRNKLDATYNGHPFTVTLQEIPSLENLSPFYLQALMFSIESNLEAPPLTNHLFEQIEISLTRLTNLFETEETSKILCAGLRRFLINIFIISGIVASFWFVNTAGLILILPYLFFYFMYQFVCYQNVSLSLERLGKYLEAIELVSAQQHFFLNIIESNALYSVGFSLLLSFFHHIFPITPIIESFYHNYFIKKIRCIQKQNIIEELIPQFEYYIMKYNDLDEAISRKKCTLQDSESIEALNQLQKKLQAMHIFYTRTLEPSRKKIAEEVDATYLFPTDLSPMMAQYL